MTTITYNKTQNPKALKCGDWVIIDFSLCVIAQVSSGKFQLIAINEHGANRQNDIIVKAVDGYQGFTEDEINVLTGGSEYQKVDVEIIVKN